MEFRATREGRDMPSQQVEFDALSKEQIAWLVQRGIEESARNSYASCTVKRCGGEEKAHFESVKAWNTWFNRLRAGEVMAGGGGRVLSSAERRYRFVVAQWLEQRGLSATDAAKAAREADAAITDVIRAAANAKGITDDDRVYAAVDRVVRELTDKANDMAAPSADDLI